MTHERNVLQDRKKSGMSGKILNLVIVLPLGIIMIVFCVANRHSVSLSFNPFDPQDPYLSLAAPLFAIVFVALIIGIVLGSAVTWFSQGRYRRRARRQTKAAEHWQAEADKNRERAEQIAGHLPSP